MSARAKAKLLNAQSWPITAIIPYERNPRSHPEKQIELLAKLMKKYGIDQPIVVDEKGIILKGHGRRLAALAAGFTEFPVIVRAGLSKTDKQAIRIADNQVALLSGWDDELLKLEVKELQEQGFDLPMLGFQNKKIDIMFTDTPNSEQQLVGLNFSIIVECESEEDQATRLQKLAKMGYKCRALIS